jgi:hypothetical protein
MPGLVAATVDERSSPWEEPKVKSAKKLHEGRTLEIADICTTLRISRSTFDRYVRP